MCLLNMAECDERFVFLSKERILKEFSLLILPRNVLIGLFLFFNLKMLKTGPFTCIDARKAWSGLQNLYSLNLSWNDKGTDLTLQ